MLHIPATITTVSRYVLEISDWFLTKQSDFFATNFELTKHDSFLFVA